MMPNPIDPRPEAGNGLEATENLTLTHSANLALNTQLTVSRTEGGVPGGGEARPGRSVGPVAGTGRAGEHLRRQLDLVDDRDRGTLEPLEHLVRDPVVSARLGRDRAPKGADPAWCAVAPCAGVSR